MFEKIPNKQSLGFGAFAAVSYVGYMLTQNLYGIPIALLHVLGIPVAVAFLMFSHPAEKKQLDLTIAAGIIVCSMLWPVILLALLVSRPWKDKRWVNRSQPGDSSQEVDDG